MSRLVIHTAKEPKKVAGKDGDLFICMCGLSTNKPFCSGAHKTIKEEAKDELNVYDEDGSSLSVEGNHDHEDGCCGGHCGDKMEDKAGCCGGGHCC